MSADTSGVIAVKALQIFNSSGVVGVILDHLSLKAVVSDALTNPTGGNDTLLYILDSNGFIVWISDDQQSHLFSQSFAYVQPIVFADMVNRSVFIVGEFAACGPKPCVPCDTDPATASRYIAAASMLKVNIY